MKCNRKIQLKCMVEPVQEYYLTVGTIGTVIVLHFKISFIIGGCRFGHSTITVASTAS